MPAIIKAPSRRKAEDDVAAANGAENPTTAIPQPHRWYHYAIFLCCSMTLLFAMCSMGRPGA